eukprot:7145204-Pyramimonas_sp.AAC.1
MAFWHNSGSSRRSSQVDTRRQNPEKYVLARFRILKLLSSNEAVPSEMNRCMGPMKKELGGR